MSDTDASALRVPPHSLEAEHAVLGALLLDNAAWDRVGDMLAAKHFYRHEHRLIYLAIGTLITAIKVADVITVAEQLKRMEQGDTCGGMVYLNSLSASVPSAANARYYAGIVLEQARRRSLIAALDNATSRVWQATHPIDEQLNVIAHGIAQLEAQTQELVPEQLSGLVVERLDHITALHERTGSPGWSTGLPQLDAMIRGGFHPGRVYLIGGRPGMGKSAFSLWTTLQRCLVDQMAALYLSQEMPKTEVTERALAIAGPLSYTAIQTGKLADRDWAKLSQAAEKLALLNFHIDEQVGLSHGDIRVKARFIKGLQLLVVDYVQLCSGIGDSDGGRRQQQTRTEELAIISRALKQLAKQLHCAVLVLSGLNRSVDERMFRRPIMSDFRDCGQLEADADVIIALFQLRAKDATGRRILGFDVIKCRQGETGCVAVDFWGDTMEFAESEYSADDLLRPDKKSKGGDL